MKGGDEQWAIPSAGNRVRGRYKIDPWPVVYTSILDPSGQGDAYCKKDRPKTVGRADYTQVRAAMKVIDVAVMSKPGNWET